MGFTITGESSITTARTYLIVANVAGVGVSTPNNTTTVSIAPGGYTTSLSTNNGNATGLQRTISAPAEPSIASTLTFGCPGTTSLILNFTGGNGTNRIVVARAGSAPSFIPTDGNPPTGVNADFTLAADQGSGNKIVYNASGTTVTVTGLSTSTRYYFTVYEYNGSGATTDYLTSSFGSGNKSTVGATPYSVTGSTYTQDFNGLPATGSFTFTGPGPYYVSDCPINASTASGWQFMKNPVTGTAIFTVADGSGTAGAASSFGTASSTDRSLGTLASGSFVGSIGLVLVNNTTDVLNTVTISFTGEQWRRGGTSGPNSMAFKYSLNGSDLVDGNISHRRHLLNFISPNISAAQDP